jgi:hypothetical protein
MGAGHPNFWPYPAQAPLRHRVLGREYKRGRLEGELKIIRMQIERRFGPLPDWAEQSLRNLTVDELENLADRVFEVQSLELLLL